jgi:starch synthase
MKILIVSAEVEPFAKVGGLADVAGSLPKALRTLGHDARVVMPLYRMIEEDPRWELAETVPAFDVPMNPHWTKTARFCETVHEGVPVGFVGTDEWFTESDRSETMYRPGALPNLFLSAAVLRAMEELDWIPDVIHANDWHTGFLPVLMRERDAETWDETAAVFTIHNLAYQGLFEIDVLDALGLPHRLFHPDRVEAWGHVNFLKAGCMYADRVNTVSPTYAEEIQTGRYGCMLDGVMRHLASQGRLTGILNGIDVEAFDPAHDPHIPARYSAVDLSGKAVCRQALLEELGLPEMEGAPVLGMVSRLSTQKGMDLVLQAADEILAVPSRLVVLGVGDAEIAAGFRGLEKRHPDRVRLVERFDAPLAQRIYAGCDGFLMPSAYEPCGLGQLIAMRYGTVPVVRRTGGLADTVAEGENGFVLEDRDSAQLVHGVRRLHAAFLNPEVWRPLMLAGMRADWSWSKSARQYVDLYEAAVANRSRQEVVA